jgi:hypothetical protein
MNNHYKEAKKRAMAKAGKGWDLLGEDLRRGLIALEVLGILQAQARTLSDPEHGGEKAPAFGRMADLTLAVFQDELG